MSLRDQIAQQALSLGPEDRVYLADLLEQSLVPGDVSTEELDVSWSEEIDRRLAAFDRGELQAADFETALVRMRQHLADHRRHKAGQ